MVNNSEMHFANIPDWIDCRNERNKVGIEAARENFIKRTIILWLRLAFWTELFIEKSRQIWQKNCWNPYVSI